MTHWKSSNIESSKQKDLDRLLGFGLGHAFPVPKAMPMHKSRSNCTLLR